MPDSAAQRAERESPGAERSAAPGKQTPHHPKALKGRHQGATRGAHAGGVITPFQGLGGLGASDYRGRWPRLFYDAPTGLNGTRENCHAPCRVRWSRLGCSGRPARSEEIERSVEATPAGTGDATTKTRAGTGRGRRAPDAGSMPPTRSKAASQPPQSMGAPAGAIRERGQLGMGVRGSEQRHRSARRTATCTKPSSSDAEAYELFLNNQPISSRTDCGLPRMPAQPAGQDPISTVSG